MRSRFFILVNVSACAALLGASGAWGFGSRPAPAPSAAAPEAVKVVEPRATPSEDVAQLARDRAEIAAWCATVKKETDALKWHLDPCGGGVDWKIGGHSVQGRPLVYAEFGRGNSAVNSTLVLSMVHGDEITPLYVGFKLVQWLHEHPATLEKSRVVIAPLVNPDGFFRRPRRRMNANGVDVNRNFATQDWPTRALQRWKLRFRSDPRRNPGARPASEPETVFQADLIARARPQKLLSIHAPLNFMDYDGPTQLSLAEFPREYVRECLKLRARLKAVSGGFYPGSLGNYAGRELGIPTLTLELPTADPARAERYWTTFSSGIRTMIDFEVPNLTGTGLNTGVRRQSASVEPARDLRRD